MASGDVRHIPIDIHLGQLSEWLVSRRHCSKDWHAGLRSIRERLQKVKILVQENPELKHILPHEIASENVADLLSVDCQALLDYLSKSEKHNATNFLGQYQDPLTKEISDVVKAYERDNVYLAELAQYLHHAVTYEIPFLKKQMQKLEQTAGENQKKAEDAQKAAHTFQDQYLKECAALGIQGKSVREELLQEAHALPGLFDGIANRIKSLGPICEDVEDFVNGVHQDLKTANEASQLFPLLRHVIQFGNTPYQSVAKPEERNTEANAEAMEMAVEEKRTRKTSGSTDTSLSVNLNDTVADHLDQLTSPTKGSVGFEDSAIDFEITESGANDSVDWDIDASAFEIDVEGSGSNSDNILDSLEYRTQLVNELHEISAFLRRRMEEQRSDHMASDLLSIPVAKSKLMNDLKSTESYLKQVKEVIQLFDDSRLQSLCKLRDSASFLDRLTRQLEQKLVSSDRMERRAEALKLSALEASAERQRLQPELEALIGRTKKVQKVIENDISAKYQERRVTILGGIQSVA